MKSEYRNVIKTPIITEKSASLAENNVIVFSVAIDANKTQIKQAVEKLFDVEVEKVNTVNVKGHKKVQNTKAGRTEGRTSDYKKAIVTLKESSKTIAFFDSLS